MIMMLISILSGSVFALPIPSQGKRHPCWNVPKNQDSFCKGKSEIGSPSEKDFCLKQVKRNRDHCFRRHRQRQMTDPNGVGAKTADECWSAYESYRVKCRNQKSRGLYQGVSVKTCLDQAEGIKKTCLLKFDDAKDARANQLSKAYLGDDVKLCTHDPKWGLKFNIAGIAPELECFKQVWCELKIKDERVLNEEKLLALEKKLPGCLAKSKSNILPNDYRNQVVTSYMKWLRNPWGVATLGKSISQARERRLEVFEHTIQFIHGNYDAVHH